MNAPLDRLRAWFRRTMPTHEQIEASRWVPRQALDRGLWRFNRRSVPRGVALGLLVGILVPFAQIVFAAMLCFTVRANVPVAAATTFVTNPLTTPLIWAASYRIGAFLLRTDLIGQGGPIDRLFTLTDFWTFVQWLTDEGRVLAFGLVVVAIVSAAAGYLATSFGWRWWVVRERRRRASSAVSAGRA